ncbi:MarR family winged helix-turn-helix transcriptional regulator [Nocardioides hwasunensis]|uniref:Winged helix-turn-helix transcriptional regulator n=1 Tax=Nocardioides hwasunensis TaxID=397258 RepID=A0ABR8ME40_9ACTN|nr:MarR family winged helix-turn-helix transcriptional regulator [Nocardioides hwasunensis]MBD3914383.1 winged helix-turn-helix transcriptional regulator [Nocardioides hwasunensis]
MTGQSRPAAQSTTGPSAVWPPVLWPVVQVGHLARRRFDTIFAVEGLNGQQFGVLSALADGDDLSSSDLARAILVRPQSMAALIDSLVQRGLVERHGPRGRGRRAPIRLTRDGHDVLTRVRPLVASLASRDVIGLDTDETTQLRHLLAKLRSALVAQEPGTEPEPESGSEP